MSNTKKMNTEVELIKGCVENNRRCQEKLYKKHFPVMMRMCMRYTRDQNVAMEIVNTGFLRVFQKIGTFAFKGSFEGWVRRLVFHSLSDHFRKEKKKIRFLDIDDNKDKPSDDNALASLYYEDIITLVNKLKGSTREVFWLFAVEGFTHVEIGKKLGISAGTSKWYLSEARKKLKVLLDKNHNVKHYHVG